MSFSDLSVEIGHFYISQLQKRIDTDNGSMNSVRDFIAQRMTVGLDAVAPIVKKYEDHKKNVTMVALIDDYFWNSRTELSRDDVAEVLIDYGRRASIPLDFVVFESALADTVPTMINRIVPFAVLDAGSSEIDSKDRARWLSNGQPGRHHLPDEQEQEHRLGMQPLVANYRRTFIERPRPHSLHIDIEMYLDESDGNRKWACPVLAAWWQLIRLGMLRDHAGESCVPKDTIDVGSRRSFFAKRTLTALTPDFLEIEAAVRTILSQVSIPPIWLKELRGKGEAPKPDEHLTRMSYIFVDDNFQPTA